MVEGKKYRFSVINEQYNNERKWIMKKVTRVLAMVLAVVLMLGLTACGGGRDAGLLRAGGPEGSGGGRPHLYVISITDGLPP